MQLHRSLDLNLKIMSNKLNQVIQTLLTIPDDPSLSDPAAIALAPPSFQGSKQGITFRVHQDEEVISNKENNIPIETAPVGFSRTSRSETFVNASAHKNVPTPSITQPTMYQASVVDSSTQHIPSSLSRIPIMQRVVGRDNKSLFMAEVEILNLSSNTIETKTRTNGTGKYQATLLPGQYKITIKKRDQKNTIELSQNITIDHTTPSELPLLILK